MKAVYQALVSVFLLGVLGFQAASSFGLTHRYRYWPFLSYPMYNRVHHAGDSIENYRLVAVFSDGRETPIPARALHLDFWQYRDGPVEAALRGRRGDLLRDLAGWQKTQTGELAAVRVENHPVVLKEEGGVEGPVESATLSVAGGAS